MEKRQEGGFSIGGQMGLPASSVVSNSLRIPGAGCHFLLQRIFPTQGSNSSVLCIFSIGKWILYHCTTLEVQNGPNWCSDNQATIWRQLTAKCQQLLFWLVELWLLIFFFTFLYLLNILQLMYLYKVGKKPTINILIKPSSVSPVFYRTKSKLLIFKGLLPSI